MNSLTEQFRDLLLGRGEFARAEAPEPSLIAIVLRFVPAAALSNVAVAGALDAIVGRYPDLRREALTAYAGRLGELEVATRGAVLRAKPALIAYAPYAVLRDARSFAGAIDDPAARALFILKLADRGVGDVDAAIHEAERLLALPNADAFARLDAMIYLALISHGRTREDAIGALADSQSLIDEPDLAAAAAELLRPVERARLSRQASLVARSMDAEAEYRATALTRLAPGLDSADQVPALLEAMNVVVNLPIVWRRAESIRHLLSTLQRPSIAPETRAAVVPLLREAVRAAGPSSTWLGRYVDTHLEPSSEPLPPVHPLVERAWWLGAQSHQRDRDDTASVSTDALLDMFGKWYPASANAAAPVEEADDELSIDLQETVLLTSPDTSARELKPARPPARPPGRKRSRPKPVSTGFADIRRPGEPLEAGQPIMPGERYHFWLEIGEVGSSMEERPTPVPVHLLPEGARLTVVLFTPDGGFQLRPDEDIGELDLRLDGSATVARQPAKEHATADAQLLSRRLFFPVRAPSEAGNYRLRCNIYCLGVLVQSRLVEVKVGATARVSKLTYSLAQRLNPAALAMLGNHRFSMLSNHGPADNHDIYIYGVDGQEPFRSGATIPAAKIKNSLDAARAALRRVSWGDEGEWAPGKPCRHTGTLDIDTLRMDLGTLAIAGRRIYVDLVKGLANGDSKVKKFETLVRKPGLVQISPDSDLQMVLPAALIYDYQIKRGATTFGMCPELEQALVTRTPLETSTCFQGHCPCRDDETMVCASGFWGFRHALGLPISDSDEEGDSELKTRIEYNGIPVMVMGISRSHDLPRTATHERELQALRPAWGDSAWLVADRPDPLMRLMQTRTPHLLYMYCHSSGRQTGAAEIPMLYMGEDPQQARPEDFLEGSDLRDRVNWTSPRPLVFLNGCNTTRLDVNTMLGFVEEFVLTAHACGVIGTEVSVFEPLAGEFARRFMDRFLGGAVVGQAVRDARLDLLRNGNPLGLAYTPFVLSGVKLVAAGT